MNEEIIKNPITKIVKQSIIETKKVLKFAVPFLSSFARSIIEKNTITNINEIFLVTRFDETNINSFDIPTLQYLLENGFKIRFNNNIHLKLYITDNKTFVTSSNLTKGGFENNTELTVAIDTKNKQECNKIFDKLWEDSKMNQISEELLKKNLPKYLILKNKEKYKTSKKIKVEESITKTGLLDIDLLLDEIFNSNEDNSEKLALSFEANKFREKVKNKLLKNKFKKTIFYVPEGHPKRKDNLFYNFVYGAESNLAGTGLREAQFSSAFMHKDFEKVIAFIFPEIYGIESWNLKDEKTYSEFCNGLFDFNIPQYSETLPIRLASFFYPEHFIPIFKLEHLRKICEPLGIKTDAKTKGDKLYAYNIFLLNKMKAVPFNNYIKARMAYQICFTVELYNSLQKGEKIEKMFNSYTKIWEKKYIPRAEKILKKLKVI